MAFDIPLSGYCDTRFERVREVFEASFRERGEVGAAFSIVRDGELVVDLVGGWRDAAKTRPWAKDTVANIWSTTKGVQAICFAMVVDRGLARYDQPIADFWPEFAARGKGRLTIEMLLSHQTGLCGFTSPATIETLLDGEKGAALLAGQAPIWEPGTASGYHAMAVGVLGTALFRRIEGRSIRQFVDEELRSGHDLDIMIGLPASETDRRAEIIAPVTPGNLPMMTAPQIAALANPVLDPLLPNDPRWWAIDLPAGNGHGNARSLAKLYSYFLAGKLARPEIVEAAIKPRIKNVDLVLNVPTCWAAGFLVNSEKFYGPNLGTFGHSGWGGSFAVGDPAAGVAFSYTMNQMGATLRDDPRNHALIAATYKCL